LLLALVSSRPRCNSEVTMKKILLVTTVLVATVTFMGHHRVVAEPKHKFLVSQEELTAAASSECPDGISMKYGLAMVVPGHEKCVNLAKAWFLAKNDPAIRAACSSLDGDELVTCSNNTRRSTK